MGKPTIPKVDLSHSAFRGENPEYVVGEKYSMLTIIRIFAGNKNAKLRSDDFTTLLV